MCRRSINLYTPAKLTPTNPPSHHLDAPCTYVPGRPPAAEGGAMGWSEKGGGGGGEDDDAISSSWWCWLSLLFTPPATRSLPARSPALGSRWLAGPGVMIDVCVGGGSAKMGMRMVDPTRAMAGTIWSLHGWVHQTQPIPSHPPIPIGSGTSVRACDGTRSVGCDESFGCGRSIDPI